MLITDEPRLITDENSEASSDTKATFFIGSMRIASVEHAGSKQCENHGTLVTGFGKFQERDKTQN